MTWLPAVVVAVLIGPPVYALAWRARTPADRLLGEHLLERYVVTLLSGESFSALLARVDGRTIVLREATVLTANNSPVDGELILRRDAVAYMQRL